MPRGRRPSVRILRTEALVAVIVARDDDFTPFAEGEHQTACICGLPPLVPDPNTGV